MKYDPSAYYVDFSTRSNLTDADKDELQKIQDSNLPLVRAEYLQDYRITGKIDDDDFEKMTGIPYKF